VALNFLLLLLLIRDNISHLSYLSIFGEYYTHLANEPIKVRTYISGYLALVVRLLQQWLSSLCNLLFRDPQDPERLWTWGELAIPLVGFAALFGLMAWLG